LFVLRRRGLGGVVAVLSFGTVAGAHGVEGLVDHGVVGGAAAGAVAGGLDVVVLVGAAAFFLLELD
jgi:hypothetical protein